ncbi:hypothetical protein C8F01DRAFT_752492 [Mycena amicta]|nr:hypothetical protein C8F01DRAFT_752492 [Mycena amicta]
MFALRCASLFLLASTALVSSAPAPVAEPQVDVTIEKRASISSITGVLNTLEGSVGSILPQIDTLVASGTAVTSSAVAPLILQLVTTLDIATTSLALLSLGLRDAPLEKRQTEQDVANLAAGLVTDIANTLGPLEAMGIAGLSGLLGTVDTALNGVLVGLDGLLAGVLTIVAGLVVTVAGLLNSLGLGAVLGSLGL